MKKEELINAGFKQTVRSDGANVLSLKINEEESLQTWGNQEDGNVLGIQHVENSKHYDSMSLI